MPGYLKCPLPNVSAQIPKTMIFPIVFWLFMSLNTIFFTWRNRSVRVNNILCLVIKARHKWGSWAVMRMFFFLTHSLTFLVSTLVCPKARCALLIWTMFKEQPGTGVKVCPHYMVTMEDQTYWFTDIFSEADTIFPNILEYLLGYWQMCSAIFDQMFRKQALKTFFFFFFLGRT